LSETLEHTARRIADQGREALLARLRPAFKEAAEAHRDALPLDDEQLEQMVQRAADRADGLQWRRALASVATEQLGIGLGEALGHPAVARAQAIVGAPSYEEALSALGAEPPAARSAPPVDRVETSEEVEDEVDEDAVLEADHKDAGEGEEDEEDEGADEDEDEDEDDEYDDEDADEDEDVDELSARGREPTAEHPPVAAPAHGPDTHDDSEEATDGVRLRAIHLGGIANLSPAEGDLELLISSDGLDIIRGPEHSVLGRLTWDEIVALETPEIGGRFRRKRQADAHLVVRSEQGSASFEIPGVTSAELREHLDPLLARR
jgi:hypothetical protein